VTASASSTLDNFLKDVKLIRYPHISSTSESPSKDAKPPRSLVMTDYHVLILYSNCVKGICTLNEEVIFEDAFDMV
jgi:hypothetical protein